MYVPLALLVSTSSRLQAHERAWIGRRTASSLKPWQLGAPQLKTVPQEFHAPVLRSDYRATHAKRPRLALRPARRPPLPPLHRSQIIVDLRPRAHRRPAAAWPPRRRVRHAPQPSLPPRHGPQCTLRAQRPPVWALLGYRKTARHWQPRLPITGMLVRVVVRRLSIESTLAPAAAGRPRPNGANATQGGYPYRRAVRYPVQL